MKSLHHKEKKGRRNYKIQNILKRQQVLINYYFKFKWTKRSRRPSVAGWMKPDPSICCPLETHFLWRQNESEGLEKYFIQMDT